MRRIATQPFAIRAWIIALLIGLAFAGLEYGLSLGAQQAASPETRSWLDLGLGFSVSSHASPVHRYKDETMSAPGTCRQTHSRIS